MAKGQELLLAVEPVEGSKTNFLSFEVYYALGGMNYATYRNEPRGIYMSASPIGIEDTERGFTVRSFGMFTGVKSLVEEAKRLNKKRVDALAAELFAQVKARTGKPWELVLHVLEKNGLRLKEELALAV